MSTAAKKWIVGLDLGPRSDGAIAFGKWLSDQGGDQLVGVHVLEEAHLNAALRYHHLTELETSALTTARAKVASADATANFSVLEVIEGRTAEETLAAAAAYRRCDGIVVGRNAPRDGHPLIRLGRVARRLLRTLPTPLVVVPPDFTLATAGKGPVLLACSLDDDALAAAEFARDFAARFSRSVELVHVAPSPDHHSAQYLPESTLAKLRAETIAEAETKLAQWAEANGLAAATRVAKLGAIVVQLAEHARARDATAIVTGSRRLSGFERLLLASAGSELSSHASCPVFVVPPK
jgi:nucleotide-binding universal stress UspA family protein